MATSTKLIDKINTVLASEKDQNKTFYSFEYFPPRTEQGVENLLDRIERMGMTNPLWVDVTWHAGGTTSNITLELCSHIQNFSGLDCLMHITCTYMTREKVLESLDRAKQLGIRNLLALRGDPPRGKTDWVPIENGFNYAVDLVRFIREKYGDYFCIGVAGYPEKHLEAKTRDDDIRYLKEKVDAGADFIITQFFYDNQIFYKWVEDCRAIGINCQIIPGIMPILGYERFRKSVEFCKTFVPKQIEDALEPIKADDEEVRKYGIEYGVEQCKDFIANGFKFLHFYTMNLERSVIEIVKGLGILDTQRDLPFKKGSNRCNEDVRPIFWAIKPKSYIARTQEWDEFPNGRWGVSRSPAFGELEQYQLVSKKSSFNQEELKKIWGEEVLNYENIAAVFINYLQGKIRKYPFSEGSLQPETDLIMQPLVTMNQNRIFTINSQPKVNGVPSTDPKFGWGPKHGYVYQKAYYEFFIPKELIEPLIVFLERFPMITYQAINMTGDERFNVTKDDVNAVTWGVFKGKEVIQPTVVDHNAFKIWKDEAFAQWLDPWALVYGHDSPSTEFLKRCHDTLYLVNVVDNDYINGDLDKVFAEFINENKALIQSL